MASQPTTTGATNASGSGTPGNKPTAGTSNVPVADINRQAPAELSNRQKKMLKRKAEAEAAGVETEPKKFKEGSLAEIFPNDKLAQVLSEWHQWGARGRDFPRSKLTQNVVRPNQAILVLQSRQANAVTYFAPARVRLIVASQTPGLMIVLPGGYHIEFRGHHFVKETSRPLIYTSMFQCTVDSLTIYFRDTLKFNALDIDIGTLAGYAGDKKKLHMMAFGLSGKFWFNRSPAIEKDLTGAELNNHNNALEVLKQLNAGRTDVICFREPTANLPVIEAYWSNLLNVANSDGDWSFYKNVLGNIVGRQFDKWTEKDGNPNRALIRQKWMQKVNTPNNSMQFASYNTKRNFATMKDFEVVFNAALIGEAQWDNVNIASHYSENVLHTAIVAEKEGGRRILNILVSKNSEFTMPATPPGTQLEIQFIPKPDLKGKGKAKKVLGEQLEFDVNLNRAMADNLKRLSLSTKGKDKQSKEAKEEGEGSGSANKDAEPAPVTEKDAMEVDPTPAEAANIKGKGKAKGQRQGQGEDWQTVEKAKPAKKAPAFPKYRCRVIELAHPVADICVSVKITDRTLDASLVVGEEIQVCLIMARNVVSQLRQMRAISNICAIPRTHPKSLAFNHGMLQSFLLGDDPNREAKEGGPTLKDDSFSRMTDFEKEAFNNFHDSCNFNGPQEEFWKGVFETDKYVNMLQGPPGTGKTTTVASTALGFALLRIRTLLVAPSNTAAQECMKKLVGHLDALYEFCPGVKKLFQVVYLPTATTTRQDLEENDELDNSNLADKVAGEEQSSEVEGFEKFKLWNYIVEAFTRDASNTNLHPANKVRQDARAWLESRQHLKSRQILSNKHRKQFNELTANMTSKIFKDQTAVVRIVVCTTSTSALLKEYGWKPWVVLIDESSSAPEPESLVALASMPRYLVLAGDHEGPKPTINSAGHNEFADQLRLSLFERFFKKVSVPMFRLER